MEATAGLLLRLEGCVVLGGCGYKLSAGSEATVDFYPDAIEFNAGSLVSDARITYAEIVSVQIDGPGTVSRGGGFIGGGFGFEGALEGIAIAGILNALTTRTKIHTFIQIVSDAGEVFLHYGRLEPGALRIAMSPIFLQLRRLDHTYIASRVQRLEALRQRDLIDDKELERLTAQLTYTKDSLMRAAEPVRPETGEWLQCQSCHRVVHLTEADKHRCPVCKQRARPG
jgi:hypothetical protein